ncbi:hypothetical protein [Aneurinibacillus migulanus]|uniref:hypothetical protein n=1 Tax=Aneurinibacillus migulanus TaxID=47500 RepID=UPI0020A0B945|nr:hypothetical protein [Aneurinibacillus migulanus]MCP1354604.1 hypothetical protein [Aneurinibacillus migulanus]
MKTIEKFPVVSPQGNEYLVRISHAYVGVWDYSTVFQLIGLKERKIPFLPKKEIVLDEISKPRDFIGSYCEVVESLVIGYEEWLETENEKEAKRNMYLSEFNAWDGIVR